MKKSFTPKQRVANSKKIIPADIVGHWEEVSTESRGEFRKSESGGEYTFKIDGKVDYAHTDHKTFRRTTDGRTRYWELERNELSENEEYIISIDKETAFKILGFDGKKMISEHPRTRIIYHYEKHW